MYTLIPCTVGSIGNGSEVVCRLLVCKATFILCMCELLAGFSDFAP